MAEPKPGVTRLLEEWKSGDQEACGELIALLYKELRGLAGSYLQAERVGHTLRPTALVHELYVKLAGADPLDLKDRGHFLAIAARQMRRLLVDHARQAGSQKRGGIRVELNLGDRESADNGYDVRHLNEALDKLEKEDERAARIVELRAKGMGIKTVAKQLGIGTGTVQRVDLVQRRKDAVLDTWLS